MPHKAPTIDELVVNHGANERCTWLENLEVEPGFGSNFQPDEHYHVKELEAADEMGVWSESKREYRPTHHLVLCLQTHHQSLISLVIVTALVSWPAATHTVRRRCAPPSLCSLRLTAADSNPNNMLKTGKGINMGDGWETARRRGEEVSERECVRMCEVPDTSDRNS